MLRNALVCCMVLAACGAPAQPPASPEPATRAPLPPAEPAAAATVPKASPPLAPLDHDAVARLAASPVAVRSNWVPPGKGERYGHAEIVIFGPAAKVREVLLDFGHYKDIVPRKFHNARVVGKENGKTDLYMQVPIMHGMVTLWDVLRFEPLAPTEHGEVLEGRFVRGNVKDANIVLTLREVDESRSLLKCDLLILPKIFAPQSAIDEELRDAAGDALDGIKHRVEHAEHPSVPPA